MFIRGNMIHKRGLKNIQFTYDTDKKVFTVEKNSSSTVVSGISGTISNDMVLNKSEAGAFSRFIFSVFQYYSHTKKKKVVKSEPKE